MQSRRLLHIGFANKCQNQYLLQHFCYLVTCHYTWFRERLFNQVVTALHFSLTLLPSHLAALCPAPCPAACATGSVALILSRAKPTIDRVEVCTHPFHAGSWKPVSNEKPTGVFFSVLVPAALWCHFLQTRDKPRRNTYVPQLSFLMDISFLWSWWFLHCSHWHKERAGSKRRYSIIASPPSWR